PDGLFVELHTRLADNRALVPELTVSSPTRQVEITAGRSVSTLAADELFSYLCVHGASSLWFRLKWITDLAALLSACPATEIERLYSRSQELGAGRAADQALLLAHHFYRTLDGTGLADRLERDRTSCWLAAAARCQLSSFTEPTERPF